MQETYDFLTELGLDEDADARAIRRAYARKLKLIDQEADPAGFQVLRSAYEVALDWAAWRERQLAAGAEAYAGPAAPGMDPAGPPPAQAASAPAPAPAPEPISEPISEPVPEPASAARQAFEAADKLADDAFGQLRAGAAELGDGGRLHDPQAWSALLDEVLAGPDMINITARVMFEARIAHVLASGWQDGNDALFLAAGTVFEWRGDQRRLAQFGQAGAIVEQAIVEQVVFDAQPPELRDPLQRIIVLLRGETPPAKRVILAYLPRAEQLLEQFPALLRLTTDTEAIARWRALCPNAPTAPAPADLVPDLAPQSSRSRLRWMWWVVGIWIAFSVLGAIFTAADKSARRQAGAPHGRFTPAPDVPTVPPTREKLDEIGARIDYVPHNVAPGELLVEYEVFLDADRNVLGMNHPVRSADPAYDKAVAEAIRAVQPYPPNTHLVFKVRLSARVRMVKKRLVQERVTPLGDDSDWRKYTVPPPAPAQEQRRRSLPGFGNDRLYQGVPPAPPAADSASPAPAEAEHAAPPPATDDTQ